LGRLEGAERYADWRAAAVALDSYEGSAAWKSRGPAPGAEMLRGVCDVAALESRLAGICKVYQMGDMQALAHALREGLVRNQAGMCHPDVHAFSRVGTSSVIEDYVNVVSYLLLHVAQAPTGAVGDEDGAGLQNGNGGGGGVLVTDGYAAAEAALPEMLAAAALPPQTSGGLSAGDRLRFFNETRHAYGRTALMLSGGAVMGLHHLGVVKALLEHDLLPRVVSGTSAGSIIAAMVGLFRDADLRRILTSDSLLNPATGQPFSFRYFDEGLSVWTRLRRLVRKGAMQDIRMLQDCLRKNFGDVTFGEAYRSTRRIVNITVCPARGASGPALLLNYLTAPNVLIWSAVSASCALPLVFGAVELMTKDGAGRLAPYQEGRGRWIDGSVTSDVPLARIGELFNCNHFIVSQTNFHILPRGLPIFHTRVAQLLKSEFQFRYWQALQLRLVPSIVSSLFPHMMQPYEGDVTIVPEVNGRDLAGLFRNPTAAVVRDFLVRGERQTFPKLDRVRMQCVVERTLDACVEAVARVAKRERGTAAASKAGENADAHGGGCDGEAVSDGEGGFGTGRNSGARMVDGAKALGRAPSWLWTDSPSHSPPPGRSLSWDNWR
jgi:TAG lipase / steryl ester hydrolase / phospholipase A2 / LPA acyltransferase